MSVLGARRMELGDARLEGGLTRRDALRHAAVGIAATTGFTSWARSASAAVGVGLSEARASAFVAAASSVLARDVDVSSVGPRAEGALAVLRQRYMALEPAFKAELDAALDAVAAADGGGLCVPMRPDQRRRAFQEAVTSPVAARETEVVQWRRLKIEQACNVAASIVAPSAGRSRPALI